MSFLAIVYPELSATDLELIENIRKKHDELYKIVKPHFTLVFPLDDFSIADFETEIKKQLKGIKPISFCIRNAVVYRDESRETYLTFLVPNEGFDEIVKLHDKLYSDQLLKHHRLDIDYIPHITIGHSNDEINCKKMADEWNTNHFQIKGVISVVDIVSYENDVVATVEKIRLDE